MIPALCHCGAPLHYTDPEVERVVMELVTRRGEYVDITVADDGGTWRVQRHYIALHGVKSWELPHLGFERVA